MAMYQDTPFNPAPYAASIGDLMLHSNDAAARAAEIIAQSQARAAEIKGQAHAAMAEAIGNAPAAFDAAQNARTDRQMKLAEFADQQDARKQAILSRTSMLIGEAMRTAKTPQEAQDGIKYLTQQGGIPAEAGATALALIDQAGPDNFTAVQKHFVDLGNSFRTPTKMGEGDTLIQGINADGTPNIVARGTAKPLTEVQLAMAANPNDPTGAMRALHPTPLPTEFSLGADAANPNSPTAAASQSALNIVNAAKNKGAGLELKPGRVGGKLGAFFVDKQGHITDPSGTDVTDQWQPPTDPLEVQAAALARQAAAQQHATDQQDKRELFQQQEAGRGQLSKIDSAYSDTQEKASTLRDFINAAKSGNKVAASVTPLLATLGLVTSEGVKRINQVEVNQIAGAGSLLDRIKGKIGKVVEGQPVPQDILDDISSMSDLLEKGARRKYENDFNTAATRYKLDDERMKPPPDSPDEGTIGKAADGTPITWSYVKGKGWAWVGPK